MNPTELSTFVNQRWQASIIPELCDYIAIPNKSPNFDPQWAENGHMDRAVEQLATWCRAQPIRGMSVEILRIDGRTPLLFVDIPGDSEHRVLLYGHYDKQPEFSGWDSDLSPWTATIRDGKLYGRGGADDGYAVFSSLTAIHAMQQQGLSHAHCIVLIEGCEESGSFDLPAYIDRLDDRIGSPDLVICLDAECGNYEQLWCTTSLRGNLTATLRCDVLSEGVHSGSAGGIVPSSFRILRQLLARIERAEDGRILADRLWVDIPPQRVAQAQLAADVLTQSVYGKYPWVLEDPSPGETPQELLLNNTWRPTLSITGAEGLPLLLNAGNVQLPYTTLKLSFRLPPTCDAEAAGVQVKALLEANPPPLARVRCEIESAMGGWNAPAVAPWLEASMQRASEAFFGRPSLYMGTGGTIPFMGMLGERFPKAQFLVTGLLGPNSNAHGPNEFLHIETGKRLTCCVAQILADHFANGQRAARAA